MANDDSTQCLLPDANSPQNAYDNHALQRRRCRPLTSSNESDIRYQEQNEWRYLQWIETFFEKEKLTFNQVSVLLAFYLGIGTLVFFLIRNQLEGKKTNGFFDAIYFCVVTMTTVGYGDLVPHSTWAKLLSCVYVFSGMALCGIVLSKAADYIVEKQEILFVRAIHKHEKIGTSEILMKEAETSKVKFKFLFVTALLAVLVVLGTLFLYLAENLELVDAFYCVCSTITTLGYGDQSFSSSTGRIFGAFWILSSTVCLAQFFLYLAELCTEKRQRSLVKDILSRNLTSSDLEAADLDHDKVVSAAEFILHTLMEMGKISQEDISMGMERFKKLDVDQSGTLTESDIVPSQSNLSKNLTLTPPK
ncbi:hypothetical protein K2173_004636 [Erythroxylum novogranatense]|uniref:Potassium channel domain-containing protein n=1 Tax=Erythroxylum novogranatense TaxID=1862640 RepID=A0AAV8SYS4_9ROSI|nr:hypothetical protein K2173_004636 [Erythroxylum novogranatense]